jgi:hypothetical protein
MKGGDLGAQGSDKVIRHQAVSEEIDALISRFLAGDTSAVRSSEAAP